MSNTSRPRPKSIIVTSLPLFNPHGTRSAKGHRASDTRVFEIESMRRLPLLEDVSSDQQPALFVQKLKHCCLVFDFNDVSDELFGKEVKQRTLRDLIDCVYTVNTSIFEQDTVYQEMFRMFSKNIFRILSPFINPGGEAYDPDEDDPIFDPSWSHLQLVYDLFIRFLDSPEFNIALAKKYVTESFVIEIIKLFNNEDPRERDLLKTVLHRIYGKFLGLRAFIRKTIANVFLEFIYETDRHNGVAEFLEFLGSIINGFALPLKEEHRNFLIRVLIPLHKARSYTVFSPQLVYCIQQYISKEPSLSSIIIFGIIKSWPMQNSNKQAGLLDELESILDMIDDDSFVLVSKPLFRKISQCISSPQFSIAERALHYWDNYNIVSKMVKHIHIVLPLVYPTLFQYSKNHWCKTIHALSFHALKVLMDGNPKFFHHFSHDYEKKKAQDPILHENAWMQIENQAQDKLKRMESMTQAFDNISVLSTQQASTNGDSKSQKAPPPQADLSSKNDDLQSNVIYISGSLYIGNKSLDETDKQMSSGLTAYHPFSSVTQEMRLEAQQRALDLVNESNQPRNSASMQR
jgi:serine/threonine-protein phosphatase 2A regulatory subunit B'